MAKRSISSRLGSKLVNSYDETQDEALERLLSESRPIEEVERDLMADGLLDAPETTKLVLKKNVQLKIIGSETANVYVFSGAGSVVDVDNRDVPKMLEKGLGGKSCCGSNSTSYFEIVR